MHPVGRLDYDSSGLLLFSSSGALTQLLLHPKHEITKEYVAVVVGTVDMEQLQSRFQKGVNTGEGMKTGEVLSVTTPFPSTEESTGPFTTVAQYLQNVKQTLPSEYTKNKDWKNHNYHEDEEVWKAESLSQVTVRVSEGKHRMVRRMLKNCGHAVVDLKRIKFGNIELGNLEVGSTRYLHEAELKWAKKLLLEHLKAKQNEDGENFLFDEDVFKDVANEKKSEGGETSPRFDDRDFNYDLDDIDSVVEQ
jgi:23S rRNA pseudouridine2605 synthase